MKYKVSFFEKATTERVAKDIPLDKWLRWTIDPPKKLRSVVEKYRAFGSKRLKAQIPCVTISATFKKVRNLKKIRNKNGLICLDIDPENNICIDLERAKLFFSQHPSTLYVGYSVSKNGIYVIMVIDRKVKLIKYFKFLRDRLAEKGINIDKQCKDYTRLRFFSVDENAYYNPDAVTLKLPKKRKVRGRGVIASKTDREKVETVIGLIEQNSVDITSDYYDWIKIAGAFNVAFGEQGRDYFHRVSRFYPEYKQGKCDKKYDSCAKMKNVSLSSFFYVADKHGIRY